MKAVIQTGGKQYLVHEGESVDVEVLTAKDDKLSFEPLLIIDGEKIEVGTPLIGSHKVNAEIVANDTRDKKVTSIRFKAKKRIHKLHGHRQHKVTLKIISIAKTAAKN